MVQISLNGRSVEAEAGRRLVEVIKENGITITNLCYIDGLEPYAGCRTCIVEIEGARPTALQLSCVAQVAEGMVVRTDTPDTKRTRQSVMSLIMANHPDRCLTCHRRVHCMPGDICLRDDVVTHRCLTCSKNYRCELQTSCENIDMGEFEEPWVGETRSYYETPPPEPDRGNPFMEFDPQMCIICTRCVRACADLRHKGALTLAGKGHTTIIAFGTGAQIHESDCDFNGACVDVCPTATLMEKPNKWVGRADDWHSSVCNSCAVGCTISYGTSDDRQGPVIVRPERLNPVSRDQICVRGRYHYDAVSDRERLSRSLVRAGDRLLPASFEDALKRAVDAVQGVKSARGAQAVAVLGSPLATNEEAYALTAVARAIGTPHIDFSHGPTHRAVTAAFEGAFGTSRLPASLTDLERSDTVVVVATDLEGSHPVASLRVKDAKVKRGGRVVLISPRWTELDRFAHAVLRVTPGHEAAVTQALAEAREQAPEGIDGAQWLRALDAVRRAKQDADSLASVVYAPNGVDGAFAGEAAKAAANLAIALRGNRAAHHLHYLPTDANVNGVADMGLAPGAGGRSFPEIIEAVRAGQVRALVVHDDNPLLNAPGTAAIEEALGNLEALVVIDSVRSTLAERATVVLAEAPFFAREGTLTSGDRRVLRHRPASAPQGQARDGLSILGALANAFGDTLSYRTSAEVYGHVVTHVRGYPAFEAVAATPGVVRAITEGESFSSNTQPVAAPPARTEGIAVAVSRPLYTSWEGATMRSDEADKLHREESVWVNPRDAEQAGLRMGDLAVLVNGSAEVRAQVRLDDGVAPGTVYLPSYYDSGAAMALFPLAGGVTAAIRLRALQPA